MLDAAALHESSCFLCRSHSSSLWPLKQDRSYPRTAAVSQGILDQESIQTLLWLPLSPDVSPPEHDWDRCTCAAGVPSRGGRSSQQKSSVIIDFSVCPKIMQLCLCRGHTHLTEQLWPVCHMFDTPHLNLFLSVH